MSVAAPESCNICGGAMQYVNSASILAKYEVAYFQCSTCCFLRTEKPYWLQEAYSKSIAATDTGIVLRNVKIARQLTVVLPLLFGPNARFLDVAGGTGLLTRLMRDNGFDFLWEDVYCENVLAFGFGAPPESRGYDAVTAFEAVEHMEQPYEFIENCISRSSTRTFIFSTEVFDPPAPPQNWWYFSRATGQHISFFAKPALEHVAKRLRLQFLSYRGLHVLTPLSLSDTAFRAALDQEEQGLTQPAMHARIGLTMSDHINMTKQVLLSRGVSEVDIAGLLPDLPAPVSEDQGSRSRRDKQDGWLKRSMRKWKRSVRKRLPAP